MLKLTLYEDDNRAVWIAAKSISSMWRGYGDLGTHIETDRYQHVVCERPEHIMAMPEMQYEIYPAFKFNSDGSATKL